MIRNVKHRCVPIGAQSSQNRKIAAIVDIVNMSKAFSGNSKLHKEMQGVAAIVAYDQCCKGETMTEKAIDAKMEMLYCGDPLDDDSIGLAEQLVKGLGMLLPDSLRKKNREAFLLTGLWEEETMTTCFGHRQKGVWCLS